MISINLLPPELEENKKLSARKRLVSRISLSLLTFVVVAAILSVVIEVYQNLNLKNANERLNVVRAQVEDYKQEEELLFVLRNRIEGINSVLAVDSPQIRAFNLITQLMPPDLRLSTFSVDKKGQVLLGGETNNTQALGNFFKNLTDKSVNQNKVTSVEVESLSLGGNGNIRFELVVVLQ